MRNRNIFGKRRRPPVAQCEDRLKLLAQELALAGGQVLVEEFKFTTDQVDRWMKLMAARARHNRVRLAVETVKAERA